MGRGEVGRREWVGWDGGRQWGGGSACSPRAEAIGLVRLVRHDEPAGVERAAHAGPPQHRSSLRCERAIRSDDVRQQM